MLITLILGLTLVATAAVFLVRALGMHRTRAAHNLGQIGSYGYAGVARAARGGPPARPLDQLAGRLGRFVPRLDRQRESSLRGKLMAAGIYGLEPQRFVGYRILSTVALPLVWLWFTSTIGSSRVLMLVSVPLMVAAGWWLPIQVVRSRASRRMKQIDYELPELIDLLVVTVEGGLGLNGSIRLAVERMRGPLAQELRLMLQEQSLGLSSNEALKGLLARCDTPAIRSFVRSVLQGETLGVSIGQIMRNLAIDMRKRRRAAAEEKAQKAPIKILFPLVFLIFPALFIVLLGPAVYQFLKTFGAG